MANHVRRHLRRRRLEKSRPQRLPGQPLAAGFFQPAAAQVPPDMIRHQQDLIGPVSQFLTGLFPAVFGGNMEDVKTASGYAMARDQAMGRLGLCGGG